jgi:hypothetical protein
MKNNKGESRVGLIILVALVISIFGLFGHTIWSTQRRIKEDALHIKLEKSEVRSFELVAVNPPKHFYVDIKDMVTGRTHRHVYVSKHCNNWVKTAVVGKVYRIVTETYLDDRTGERKVVYKNLYGIFCGG